MGFIKEGQYERQGNANRKTPIHAGLASRQMQTSIDWAPTICLILGIIFHAGKDLPSEDGLIPSSDLFQDGEVNHP